MPERDRIVAVSFLTAPEFERWGSKLRNVYALDGNSSFEDLLKAIDKVDAEQNAHVPALQRGTCESGAPTGEDIIPPLGATSF